MMQIFATALFFMSQTQQECAAPRYNQTLHALNTMRATATDGVAWSVCMCLSVSVSVSHGCFCKTAEPIQMPLRGGWLMWAQRTTERDNFWRLSGPFKSIGSLRCLLRC